jgi:hypothetical protein
MTKVAMKGSIRQHSSRLWPRLPVSWRFGNGVAVASLSSATETREFKR